MAPRYLITDSDGKNHLPYTDEAGKADHNLMGAAHAALLSPDGYRGNRYEGPGKEEAISKLKSAVPDRRPRLARRQRENDGL
jgi:hypothetical protein